VKRFLELAYDESSTEEIEKSLQAFKEKRESAPHYAKSIEFGETLIRLLTPFSADVAKRKQARISQADLDREAGQARCSVHARRTILEGEVANLTTEIENYTNRIDDLGRELRRLNTFARNYKSLGKRLKIDETKKAYEVAATAEAEANLELEILKAGKEFATVRSIENEHAALVRERDKLREDLRPQLSDLRFLGARLKAAWCRRVADLAAAHDLTKELVQTAQSKIVALTDKKAELSASITGAEKDKESAQKAIRSTAELIAPVVPTPLFKETEAEGR
jgi:F0F1-type ATP synthase membrane subunit b/b'